MQICTTRKPPDYQPFMKYQKLGVFSHLSSKIFSFSNYRNTKSVRIFDKRQTKTTFFFILQNICPAMSQLLLMSRSKKSISISILRKNMYFCNRLEQPSGVSGSKFRGKRTFTERILRRENLANSRPEETQPERPHWVYCTLSAFTDSLNIS